MTFKEMIFEGLCDGTVKIISNLIDGCIACQIGEFDGFSYASWRANAVYRTLEDMCYEGLLTEKEYRECKV